MLTKGCVSILVTSSLFLVQSATIYPTSNLPSATLEDLKKIPESQAANFLRDSDGEIGVFAITNLGSEYTTAVLNFQKNAPDCLESDNKLPVRQMPHGSSRRTYATETSEYPLCVRNEAEVISGMFKTIETLVFKMIKGVMNQELNYIVNGKVTNFEDSLSKDHLHVYSQPVSSKDHEPNDEYLVPYHIDNGLFLIITPFSDPSLEVKLSNGQKVTTGDVGPDSVLVLMGRGLTEWLLPEDQVHFYAVPHAVPSLTFSKTLHRSVFARMKVAQSEAISLMESRQLHFSELFLNQEKSSDDLCVSSVPEEDAFLYANEMIRQNRQECENGAAYCWMACLPLNGCNVDEAECYSNNHTQCFDDSMDPSCEWHCKDRNITNEFCLGATDMLMQGFQTTKQVGNSTNLCIILFAKKWTLSSAGKFAAGCIGVFFLGLLIEAIIALRRFILGRIGPTKPWLHLLVTFILYSVNLTLGYLAMLVAMTYSVELFICVILGLSIGHVVFNSKMPVSDTIDPCCASESGYNQKPVTETAPLCDSVSTGYATNDSTSSLVSSQDEKDACCSKKL